MIIDAPPPTRPPDPTARPWRISYCGISVIAAYSCIISGWCVCEFQNGIPHRYPRTACWPGSSSGFSFPARSCWVRWACLGSMLDSMLDKHVPFHSRQHARQACSISFSTACSTSMFHFILDSILDSMFRYFGLIATIMARVKQLWLQCREPK